MNRTEMEMSGPGVSRHSRIVKRRRWKRLRQQWKLLGLFEIDQQHEFYSLTCMMKEGLCAAVQNTIDNPLPDELSEDDYTLEVTQIHKDFRMETYAGPVFASLRRSLGMTEKEYQQSLSSEGSYLQFISNSKSKADFFLTNDKRFFLKTQSKSEVRFLLSNLRIYMEHLEKYPHSLLVKFLGVHRIKIAHQRMEYFIVMQSVFYPDDRITTRYDIKGCEVSRWTDPAPEGSQSIIVLKDLNFEGKFIQLDQQRPWLLRQVEIDTAFLQTLNVLDYSLLLAHQPLHQDELSQSLAFTTLIMRAKKSVNATSSPTHATSPTVPGTVAEEDSTLLSSELNTAQGHVTEMHSGNCSTDIASPEEDIIEQQSRMGTESADLQTFQSQNRRLLPNFKNSLHVIDGSEQRYFVGIIDIFTVYGFKKRLEHLWKRLRHPRQSFSTVSPPAYCHRLCQWVQDHTK
ncbi:phosphatidylinositol 4-phosphate 5-kinase-like protein 1 isoform X1 [Carassius carassius]|uniref:phosphatidylinositol 4-phosphate 5-kinase-like protein 1 isoform X1 n=1 Tax=Carassius carassius TaxID=217509 RepID=UPI00286968E2|nr:phosphatidylinositol 4-phosphate 5-kinase-like protein 1 isoform X1 [Carassius carassius]